MKSRPDGCEGSPPSRSRPEPDCPICREDEECPGPVTVTGLHACATCGDKVPWGELAEGECPTCFCLPLPDQAVDPQPSIRERTQGIAKALEYAIRLEAEHAELLALVRRIPDAWEDPERALYDAAHKLLERIDNRR